MHLYRVDGGIARRDDDELLILDLPHRDIGELLSDDVDLAYHAAVRRRIRFERAALLAPVARPRHFVLSGLIYSEHVAESKQALPTVPSFRLTPVNGLDAPYAAIVLPKEAPDNVDYEGEVALVIGRPTTRVPPERAWECIAGLMIVNDISERKEQLAAMNVPGWDSRSLIHSKTYPSFKPSGPAFVSADEFCENPDLEIETLLNGSRVQHDRTSQMLFSFTEVVSAISFKIDLEAGDVISTGTPAGVALSTGRYLAGGDRIEVRVEKLGALSNPVVAG
jgi:2-keto-4-pentenoate hydratase/2-oxohepta-3-ene-1,7-dioic acid hydratase in catechol pathway